MADAGRLRALRSTVLKNQEKWEQQNWAKKTACGTTMCLAGWAVTLAGREFSWSNGNQTVQELLNTWGYLLSSTLTPTQESKKYEGGDDFVSEVAQEWLGLTEDEADNLFYAWDKDLALSRLDELIEEYSTQD